MAFPSVPGRRHAGATVGGASRRFSGGTLLAAGGLALLAGIGSAAAVTGPLNPWRAEPVAGAVAAPPADADADADADAAGAGGAGRTASGGTASGGTASGGAASVDDGLGEPFVPDVDVVASPAAPVLLDMDHVGVDGLSLADRSVGLLSREVPPFATGELVVVAGSVPAPHPERPVRTIRVEVEAGLAVDGELFAATVMSTLNDPRSWGGDGSMSFARTDGPADIRVVLATPDKVDAMCAPLNTHGDYSCGRYGHAAINYLRWVTGTEEYLEISDITTYRQYVVNHEVGHLLGRQHRSCPAAGERAPIMQQQSIRVGPCVANAWPFPDNPLP